MRGMPLIVVFTLSFLPGCNLAKLVTFNVVNEPLNEADSRNIQKRAMIMAQEAWLTHLSHIPEGCPPDAYQDGFVDGYSDYLLYGGNGAPPALPPVSYRRRDNLCPEGHLEIKAYYAGFAAGAAEAMQSGLRTYFMIPISTPLAKDAGRGYAAGENPIDPGAPDETRPPEPLTVKPLELSKPIEAPAVKPLELSKPIEAPAVKPVEPAKPKEAPAVKPVDPPQPKPMPLPVPSPSSQWRPAPRAPGNGAADQSRAGPLLPPPTKVEAPVRADPADEIHVRTETALPREFSVPILGGPASR